ncbi:CG0192-related protein [Actinoplanes sp. CA-030573]|uniref:CG0192-related protein n=1 Tax=Actinoplanes sp. CA-030573 TaxID=3239898 RepID=UPI003D8C857D
MATIHRATIKPTKLELLEAWLPGRHWYPGEDAGGLERVAAFRFDDPAGEVGVETFVVRAADGPLVHVPMTYRGEPLEDGEFFLIGTMEHSVLGTRWVYDAVGDPVYVETLTTAIRTGGGEAEEIIETDDGPQRRDPLMTVRGSGMASSSEPVGRLVRVEDGDPAVVVAEAARLDVRRVLSPARAEGDLHLEGRWPELEHPVVLAVLY